ncbi:hypothetical protein [Paenibacillus polymyxa]|uniref:hypothetical protein n=1 Tax=Paenibacillus polymyxa TaxID=1406 RepID=UPI0008B8A804|nr:hypothetical protein [Paenibacillus polymyxa]SEI76355.1 hypothetical protein SAMN04488600_101612 [Paenibacillus polymyxa]
MTDKPERLISADKLLEWAEYETWELYCDLKAEIECNTFDPDPPRQPDIQPGDRVRHKHSSFKYYGIGRVKEIAASGKRAYVEWPDYDRKKLLFGQPTPAYYLVSKLQKVEGEEV